MDNGIYVATARQMALFRDMDVTATNIANMATTGYQSEHLMFDKYLVNDRVGSDINFSHDKSTYRNTAAGSYTVTENPLDVAIRGNGYFVVQTPLGDRYTKAGNFQLNNEGMLVTHEGYPVLDQNNQTIVFEPDANEITIGSTGIITVNGEEFSSLAVVEFENEQLMQRHGNRLYSSDVEPVASLTSEVLQGTLERSNVSGVEQLTHMINVSRAVGSTAKYVEIMYDLQRRNTTTWTQQG